MKTYNVSIDKFTFFADDDDFPTSESVREEIAFRLNIDEYFVFVEEDETIEE